MTATTTTAGAAADVVSSPRGAPNRAEELRRRIENRRRAALVREQVDATDDDDRLLSLEDPRRLELGAPRDGPAATSPTASSLSPVASSSPLSGGPKAALARALPRLLGAKRDLYGIQMEVLAADAQQAASIACADRQFTTEKAMRRLKSDLSATQSTIRQKVDRLTDLHARVRGLQRTLHEPSPNKTHAVHALAVREQLRQENLTIQVCPRCRRGFLPDLLAAHELHCHGRRVIALPELRITTTVATQDEYTAGQNNHHAEVDDDGVRPALPKFISQPPRNLRVIDSGIAHNSITLKWDPPIFTGSAPIVDYVLQYAVVATRKRQADGSIARTLAPATHRLRLSQWCLTRPVPANEFSLTHLTADEEYAELSITAITKNGQSAASNVVALAQCAAAVASTAPLFVAVGAVTAKTITLSWSEPMDDGGRPIVDYEIAFVEAVMEETVTFDKNFLDVSEVVYKPRLVRTHSAATTFTLTDLLSGKEHKQFEIRAVNAAGIPGAFSQAIEAIVTVAPGNEFRLLDELQAAVNARTRIVDSQFLSGFMQRYERNHYIDLVSRFILSLHPEFEPKVQAILARRELSVETDDDEPATPDDDSNPRPTIKRFEELTDEEMIAERRRQFHFRLAELRKELQRVEYNVQWCKDRRIELVALIRAAETRILDKQAELERARSFRGPQMDSDVLEQGLQRFHTKDLVTALEDEIEIEQLYIVDAKAEIIQVENYLRADEKHRATVFGRLEERQRALEAFEAQPTVDPDRGRRQGLARLRDGLLSRTFAALAKNRDEARDMRRKMRVAIMRVVTHKQRMAWWHWRDVARAMAQADVASGVTPGVVGLGSIGLRNAAIGRDELVLETRELLSELRGADVRLQALAFTQEQLQSTATAADGSSSASGNKSKDKEGDVEARYQPFWLEAAARMDVGDVAGAQRLYQLIVDHPQWPERMDPHRRVELQLQLGRADFALGRHDQARVGFHRALLLAARAGGGGQQRALEGAALLELGRVDFALRAVRSSIDHYEKALLCFEALRDRQGELACYRGLEAAFRKLEDVEMTEANARLADEIEFALAHKLESASAQLQQLQSRLVGIGAESSKEIVLERVGAIVARLRRERIRAKYKIREEHKWAASLESLLAEKKALLAQGELDLKRALASDSTQVDSTVLSGTSARYELEDFTQKLAKLMGSVKAGEEHITREIANAHVRVRNLEDEIRELEAELAVETGALMRRMRAKEPLRCFRFNATNEALKNVIGTASHGIPTCVATAACSGLLFDLLSGACLSHALGDVEKQHLGDPTGHRALIVSLAYVGARIYTGSMDATVGVWGVDSESIGGFAVRLERLLTAFDAAVVSLDADAQWLVAGCADCDVFVFDTTTLAILARIIGAHEQSPTALLAQSHHGLVTTGGADHRIKVWRLGPPTAASSAARRKVELLHTLEAERHGDTFRNGHLHAVSCVRQVASEIVSADTGGRIVIWNLDVVGPSKLLRLCDAHARGSATAAGVTCLQFDAIKIVSGGSDGRICVTDFATGQLLQTLVGHESGLLDLQFDRKRLVSMSRDGRVRLWYWQTRLGAGGDRRKYHILGAGETLKSLSLKYRTSIDRLLAWNRLPDSSKMYLGQKLVVEIDSDGAASDELETLDTAVSVVFGKLAFENLDFLAANKVQSADVESQWAAQRLALLAKEYFPPLTDDEDDKAKGKKDDEEDEDEPDSDEDSVMAVDEDEAPGDEGDAEGSDDKPSA